MAGLFVQLYDFFQRRRSIFWATFIGLVAVLSLGAANISLEEDITKFFPDDPRTENLQDVFQRSRFVERLVIMVTAADTTIAPQPDSLVLATEMLIESIELESEPYVRKVSGRIADDQVLDVFRTVYDHLPVFLNDLDFLALDSITNADNVSEILNSNYRLLISPSGIALKRFIAHDPLGFSFLALRKLQQLQYDENFDLYDNYIVTHDHRSLIIFLEPAYGPQDTGHNATFIKGLDKIISKITATHPSVNVSYFGATSVAVGNSLQLRKDSMLTVAIMVSLLCFLLIGFFRKKRAPLLILIPVVFGALFSLCWVYLLQGTLSVLALAAGSIILGIAVNYALHFLVHLRYTNNMKEVIQDLVGPLTLGGITTVLAFLCLQFANAAVLRDVGLFAGLSLIGAAVCTLIFLPQLVPEKIFTSGHSNLTFDYSRSVSPKLEKWLVVSILIATPVFLYFAQSVNFNADMSRLNYMNDKTREAQHQLESINKSSLGSIYIIGRGKDLEHALRKTEAVIPVLDQLNRSRLINKYTSPSLFLVSDSLQRVRIQKWNSYWTPDKVERTTAIVRKEAAVLKFSEQVMQNFQTLITKKFETGDTGIFLPLRRAFFDHYIIEKEGSMAIISLVNVPADKKLEVYKQLHGTTVAVDRQMLTNLFVEYVHADFDLIVLITAILVFTALFISYGRIELTLITFLPMFITWIWILGIMSLMHVEFNIINVMVSTFVFGLGDDYSIFIMDGLLQQYRTGKRSMPAIRTSIVLSAIATMAGLGVLIFAEHPALRSIATISIIGIGCVLIMSQLIEPYLFNLLITNRTLRGRSPMTWVGVFSTAFTYGYFAVGSIITTILGVVLRLFPFAKRTFRYILHTVISFTNSSLIFLAFPLHKKIVGKSSETFQRPSVIVANHSSFLDILLVTMLHPKLILLTNKWVWNSPLFGGVVRLAEYYPVMEGAEDGVSRLSARVKEGYAVVVFPEGKRSIDGTIQRFHKGAFYLAERLQLPIQPLMIHGAAESIPKGTFYVNASFITLKFLPPIDPHDVRFGHTYPERTKLISRYFREEFNRFSKAERTAAYYVNRLISTYLYKGPVLEWYLRVKLRLENNYEIFHELLPEKGNIIDLGCGYGFLCYMLQYLAHDRNITGVDYDEQKIATAQGGYSRTSRLNFYHDDVMRFPLQTYDGIIISDVLHYLVPEAQENLLKHCFKVLRPGGILVIREGNADLKQRHWGTQLTELFSVKLFKFNKSVNPLSFVSGEKINKLAIDHGLQVEIVDETKFTSNVIFALRRPYA